MTTSPTFRRATALGTGSALVAGAMLAFAPISPAAAANTSTTFSYTGTTQTFAIPTGVQVLSILADGGAGAAGASGGAGGLAGVTSASVSVGSASSLSVIVGGAGSGGTGGFNGGGNGGTGGDSGQGGGGGGASTVVLGGSPVLIAPGGGGGGGNGNGNSAAGVGGAGGAGSQNGSAGSAGTNNSGGDGAGGAAAAAGSGTGSAGGTGGKGTFNTRRGGGGGGGGGGLTGGAGGGGGTGGVLSSGAGGGGGAGNAFVAAGATNVSYAGTSTGNGGVTLSYLDITTNGLPDGRATNAYGPVTLGVAGGTAPYTWTLVNSADLPTGMTFDGSTGTLAGTPSAQDDVVLNFTVTDANGLTTSASFQLDVLAATAIVGDAPASDVAITTATGNGTVWPGGGSAQPISAAFCTLSTSANMSGGVTVPVSQTAPFNATTSVSCPFTGLSPATTYYYTVSATQPTTGTESSGNPQAFETEPKVAQTFTAPFPKKIKYKGLTTLLKKKSKTSAGQPVKVTLAKSSRGAYNARGDMRYYTKITKKNGKVLVRTYGKKFYLKVTYSAPATATATAYKAQKVYLVRKATK